MHKMGCTTPYREDLVAKVTNDRIKLYTKDLPPERIPIMVALFDISNVVPGEVEIATAVYYLKNGKSLGPSKITAETLKV